MQLFWGVIKHLPQSPQASTYLLRMCFGPHKVQFILPWLLLLYSRRVSYTFKKYVYNINHFTIFIALVSGVVMCFNNSQQVWSHHFTWFEFPRLELKLLLTVTVHSTTTPSQCCSKVVTLTIIPFSASFKSNSKLRRHASINAMFFLLISTDQIHVQQL